MQSILAALSDELSQLATTADKINEMVMGHINAVSIPQTPAENTLELQIAQLTKQVTELAGIVHHQSCSNERSHDFRNRQRSQSGRHKYKEFSQNMCFYHTNFRSKAKKCKSPCSFASENRLGDCQQATIATTN